MLVGTVAAFDEPVGLGLVTADGGDTFDFHCVSIADGSRTVEVGRRVRFVAVARLGRWEAHDLEQC